MERMLRVCALCGAFAVAGCNGNGLGELTSFSDTTSGLQSTAEIDYYPSDKLLAAAKNHFREGNYGHAQKAYQKAVEIFPNDPEAWLGLAASYDRLRRFDQSDLAYRKLAGMLGGRPEYYNNVGYSYMLRGDLVRARQSFLKAYELDPSNERTANNIELLRSSMRFAKRA